MANTVLIVLRRVADQQWITVVLALIGKCGIAGAFAIIWLYSSEIFPTVMRNSALGTSSVCARIGGIVSPYIANLVNNKNQNTQEVFFVFFYVPP